MNFLSISYRMICSIIGQLRNRKVNEERLFIMLSCLSLKLPIFNKGNACIYVSVMLLIYFLLVSLVHI